MPTRAIATGIHGLDVRGMRLNDNDVHLVVRLQPANSCIEDAAWLPVLQARVLHIHQKPTGESAQTCLDRV